MSVLRDDRECRGLKSTWDLVHALADQREHAALGLSVGYQVLAYLACALVWAYGSTVRS